MITPDLTTELHQLRAGSYQVDKSHARVIFKVNHLGLSTYLGRFNDFDATLDFEPEDPANSILQAIVKTASLDLNDEVLEKNLSGADWFHASQFPEAVFTTLSVQPISDTELIFIGNLSLRGISKPVEMKIDFHGGATNLLTGKYTLGFTAQGTINRSDYGMDKYLGLVGDEVTIEVYAEFQRR